MSIGTNRALLIICLAGLLVMLFWYNGSDIPALNKRSEVVVVNVPAEFFSNEYDVQEVEIDVRNESSMPVGIERIIADCSCTTGQVSETKILPRSSSTVPLTIRWGGKWGQKEMNVTLAMSDSTMKRYLLKVERYPRLSFEKQSYSFLCADDSECYQEVRLFSNFEASTLERVIPAPVVEKMGENIDIEYLGEDLEANETVGKRVYRYRVCARRNEYSETAVTLSATSGTERCSCHVKFYWESKVRIVPNSIFLGRFAVDDSLRRELVVESLVTTGEHIEYKGIVGESNAFTLTPLANDSSSKVPLVLEVRSAVLSHGPFVETIEVQISVDGSVVRLPIRVSGFVR